jgi:hypothetical protein
VGGVTGSSVVVSRAGAGGWTALGGELGANAQAPSIIVDDDDRPVVAWSESAGVGDPSGATVQAARWDGAAWQVLPSPGAGQGAVVARPAAGGDPLVAWAAPGGIAVHRLAGDAWQAVGPVIPAVSSFGTPAIALAAATDDAPSVGYVVVGDGTGGFSTTWFNVFTWTGGEWRASASIDLGVTPLNMTARAQLAAAGAELYAAYDRYSGHTFSVHVDRRAGGVGWQPLGGELDVDPPANAMEPAIALDADGAPIVAWREVVESQWRGFVMRWDGATWRPVGGDAWNADATRSIQRPSLALARGRAAVVAWAGTGGNDAGAEPEIHVSRFNGPAGSRFGRDSRASIAGCAFDGTQQTLSETGCFMIANGRAIPHPGLVPFDLVSELWSDGALKRRWLALPDGQMMTTPETGAWTAPPGAMILKEFAIETTPGDPTSRRVMETRFLIQAGGMTGTWSGFSFRWRADGSDADLLPDAAITVDWPLSNGTSHTHAYPSRQQCTRCHHASNGPLLGLRTGQLARKLDYDGVLADQLATLAHIGAIPDVGGNDVRLFSAPHDPSEALLLRVRGYLAANCSHCHNPGGERPTRDFRWETPLAATNLCGVVTPGNPQTSLIYQRVSARPGMPPIATLQTDPMILDILPRWISSITTCP